jgi:transposase InsO family protein
MAKMKHLEFLGDSLEQLREFPFEARKEAGVQLRATQRLGGSSRPANVCGMAFAKASTAVRGDELLDESLIFGFDDERAKITDWIDDYDQHTPHSALGCLTPPAYAANIPQNASTGLKNRRGSSRR